MKERVAQIIIVAEQTMFLAREAVQQTHKHVAYHLGADKTSCRFTMKKADMSMQTIVVAVIVLFIAAILIYMSGTRLGLFDQSVSACEDRGGQCMGRCGAGLQPYYVGNSACGEGQVCCISGDGLLNN